MSYIFAFLLLIGLVLLYFIFSRWTKFSLIPAQETKPEVIRMKYYDSSVSRASMVNTLNLNREMFRSNELPKSMPQELQNNQKTALRKAFPRLGSNSSNSVNYPVDEERIFDYSQERGVISERVAVKSGNSVKKATVQYNLKTGYVTVNKDAKPKGD